ncbi:TMEM165/GDT1 family protein [Chitiniphilus purpureus]|uniref:GDT1 family protein n=1 Tax=Chitiniphilus purpureus TaxID=2981137 RepID=A0ABY6DJ91_9NEIS|nr:TMEM165/GDT1 family protein [Chitiniphilus sp. CD1]UXY14397.1 TMEM165/GDT1 family protein [Chitiniphilus sp. CD1]
MDAFLLCTGVVALAEIGDKTQLLALILAARFGRPWPIVAGVLVATLLNHFAAAWLGQWLAALVDPVIVRWIVGIGFLAIALWACIPDQIDENATPVKARGAFLTTTVAFFLAEIGDKTQVATIALAVKYSPLWVVVVGTTAGMMIANVPAVWLGRWLSARLGLLRYVRFAAAAVFAVLGVLALAQVGV